MERTPTLEGAGDGLRVPGPGLVAVGQHEHVSAVRDPCGELVGPLPGPDAEHDVRAGLRQPARQREEVRSALDDVDHRPRFQLTALEQGHASAVREDEPLGPPALALWPLRVPRVEGLEPPLGDPPRPYRAELALVIVEREHDPVVPEPAPCPLRRPRRKDTRQSSLLDAPRVEAPRLEPGRHLPVRRDRPSLAPQLLDLALGRVGVLSGGVGPRRRPAERAYRRRCGVAEPVLGEEASSAPDLDPEHCRGEVEARTPLATSVAPPAAIVAEADRGAGAVLLLAALRAQDPVSVNSEPQRLGDLPDAVALRLRHPVGRHGTPSVTTKVTRCPGIGRTTPL